MKHQVRPVTSHVMPQAAQGCDRVTPPYKGVTPSQVPTTRAAPAAASSATLLILTLGRRSKLLSPDEADLRLLLALETFPADADGLRSVGMEDLARAACVPYATARRSRDRVIADGLVACEPGNGRGNRTRWWFTSALKVLSQGKGEQISQQERCSPEPQPPQEPKPRPSSGKHPRGRGTPAPAPAREVLADHAWCRDCGFGLDAYLAAAGMTVHPGCIDPLGQPEGEL